MDRGAVAGVGGDKKDKSDTPSYWQIGLGGVTGEDKIWFSIELSIQLFWSNKYKFEILFSK